jgi:hypothetical protein
MVLFFLGHSRIESNGKNIVILLILLVDKIQNVLYLLPQ